MQNMFSLDAYERFVAIDKALCMYNNEGSYNDSNQEAE